MITDHETESLNSLNPTPHEALECGVKASSAFATGLSLDLIRFKSRRLIVNK